MNKEKVALAKDIIMHCRLRIQDKYPIFTIALYFLTLEADREIESIATDGYYLYYNPDYIIDQYKEDKKILYLGIVHSLLHCLLRHFSKKQCTYYELYDTCMDVLVYLMLTELGFITKKARSNVLQSIPELDNYLKKNNNKGTASIYNQALKDDKLSSAILNNSSLFQLDIHEYWTKPKPRKHNQKGAIPKNISMMWTRMYKELANMLALGNMRGNLSGEFVELFVSEDCDESRISYEEHLRRLSSLDEVFKIDTDSFDLMWYTTGLDMYGDMPIIEYNEVKETHVINEFILAIDTSGSCSGEIMKDFLSETIKIFEDMELGNRKLKAKIIQCDAEIVHETDISSSDDIERYTNNFQAFGFGGTDFVPVFNRIEELQEDGQFTNLKGLIYLTDGDGRFPDEKPPYETILVLPDSMWLGDYIPEWATVVNLGEKS